MKNEVVVLICMVSDLVQYVKTYQGPDARGRAAAGFEVYTGMNFEEYYEACNQDEDPEEILGDWIGTQIVIDANAWMTPWS
ncbi:hypothetical protein [Paenibacillus shenyangensis]|uniref:hypothetical protein n=1 Tax=Paenibacillus sp. A9 TaxID=1284352 RepID=UPI000377E04A|nr:hypothetical protein [Paenibacillus sp. A9]